MSCGLVALLASVWLMNVSAAALDVTGQELVYMGEYDGLYRYAFADGAGFLATVQNGEQRAAMAAFVFDDAVQWTLVRDGMPVEYLNETIVEEPGQYSLVVIHPDGSKTGGFSFSVAGPAAGLDGRPPDSLLEGALEFGRMVDNARLTPSYDAATGRYGYRFPNGARFDSNVPRGALTDGGVALYFSEGTEVRLWLDDQRQDYRSGQTLTAEGVYRFELRQLARFAPGGDPNVYSAQFVVRVLRSPDSRLDYLPAPDGFVLTGVIRDGQPLPPGRDASYRLDGDGAYTLAYAAQFAPGLILRTSVLRDTSAPLLFFSEPGLSGLSQVPVLYAPSEPDASVTVRRNGAFIENTGVLAANGTYALAVTDPAGNARVYHLCIQQASRYVFDWRLLVLAVPAAAVLAVWLWRVRRLRVI